MEERPHLNPHRDRELQVGKAADRFEAGPSTVKAARIEPVMTRGRKAALSEGVGRTFKDWRAVRGYSAPYWTSGRERSRPPPVETGNRGGGNLLYRYGGANDYVFNYEADGRAHYYDQSWSTSSMKGGIIGKKYWRDY